MEESESRGRTDLRTRQASGRLSSAGRHTIAAGATVVVGILVQLFAAAGASAGTFLVQSCNGAVNYDSGAFAEARSSSRMLIKRACDVHGPGYRGLITANRRRSGRVHYGEHATVVMPAADGTQLTRVEWAFKRRRPDCDWSVQLYAVHPGSPRQYLYRLPAHRVCTAGAAEASGFVYRNFRLGSATAIVQQIVCRDRHGCSTSRLNMVRTYGVKAWIADYARPDLRILGGGLASGRWVRGSEALQFAAADNVGIRDAGLALNGAALVRTGRACNFARPAPCPNGPGELLLDTTRRPDGRYFAELQVDDAGGNRSSAFFAVLIDNTPPGRVPAQLVGGETWRRTNAFTVAWTNPREAFAPIAGALYRLCDSHSAGCATRERSQMGLTALSGITVPRPGDWTLSLWRRDAAGNANPGYASDPVHLRFDPDPPRLAFEQQTLSDPTRISLLTSDAVSGVAGGEIQLHRRGTSTWQTLPLQRDGSRLFAHVDDSGLPAGTYEFRGRAFDQAHNEASTTSRVDGSPMVLDLPVRFRALMRAGIVRTRVVRRRGRHRRIRRRRIVRLVPKARIRFNRTALVRGELANADGQPFADATIYVFSRTMDPQETFAGITRTDARGEFAYRVRGSSSKTLRFVYLGTPLALPAESSVRVLVPATSTMRASKRRARNGSSVMFRGRVRTLPVPPTGKLVEMQAHFRGRWRTFSTVRTDALGRWHFRYRFSGTSRTTRYRFRARLPAEAGYPFEGGRSRTVRVTVLGG